MKNVFVTILAAMVVLLEWGVLEEVFMLAVLLSWSHKHVSFLLRRLNGIGCSLATGHGDNGPSVPHPAKTQEVCMSLKEELANATQPSLWHYP